MNNWENILKGRDREGTRITGGNPVDDLNPKGRMDSLDEVFEGEMDDLANLTRYDLVDKVMERLANMSKDELISILERTQGTLEEKV